LASAGVFCVSGDGALPFQATSLHGAWRLVEKKLVRVFSLLGDGIQRSPAVLLEPAFCSGQFDTDRDCRRQKDL
jgi:hypothetical protein